MSVIGGPGVAAGTVETPPTGGGLQLEGVTHQYRPGAPAVIRDVSLEIGRGESVSIVGPSGSGKTTLLAILGLLLPPSSGVLRIDGREVGRDAGALRTRHFGWVFQTSNVLARRSVADNAMLGLLARGWQVEEARPQALRFLDAVGLAAMADRRAHTLSGGELQRLCVARALAPEPRFVLADEPTGQLDRATTREVVAALLDGRAAETSVIIVTHDPTVARRCERVLGIDDGVVRALPHAELA